jgi:GAF domain-containing protein
MALATVLERTRAEELLAGQKEILERIQRDEPLGETLAHICHVVEGQSEGLLASVLLLDESGDHLQFGAAPSLPEAWNKAVHGVSIGPTIGSCGAAAYTGEPCIVEDIALHANWVPFKPLAEAHGLRACWSTPIRSYEGNVIATFAMYYRQPKKPTHAERRLIEFTSHLVAIAINRHRERESLKAG